MKSITNKTTDELYIDETGREMPFRLTTALLIKTAIKNTPAGGFEVTDMMNRLKISKVLEDYEAVKRKEKRNRLIKAQQEAKALAEAEPDMIYDDSEIPEEKDISLKVPDYDGVIKLEDTMFDKFGEYVKPTKWLFMSQNIVDFCELFNTNGNHNDKPKS